MPASTPKLIVAISVLVLLLLIWVVIRYRRAANPIPSKTSHNTAIEVIWTLAPVIILVLIAVPSIGLLQAQFKPAPAGAVTLKAIGNQWYWSYQYPDHGGIEITANMLKEPGQTAGGERKEEHAAGHRGADHKARPRFRETVPGFESQRPDNFERRREEKEGPVPGLTLRVSPGGTR